MNELCTLILSIILGIVLFIFLIAFFVFLFISLVHFFPYAYDSVFGSLALRLGHWIGRKMPSVKKVTLVQRIWKTIQPKEFYTRYETPFFTFFPSYLAILALTEIIPNSFGNTINYIIASVIYLGCYFLGMKRKLHDSNEKYERALNNNLEFLKLSFLPITFVITVLGFVFTATNFHITNIPFTVDSALSLLSDFFSPIPTASLSTLSSIWEHLWRITLAATILFLLLYVISLPLQVLSYFLILVIQYARKHGHCYKHPFLWVWDRFFANASPLLDTLIHRFIKK